MPGISKRSFVLGWLLGAAAMSTLGNPRAFGATIQVTSTQQKISGTGGCSLQEAIWAANFDASSALVAASNEIIATECTAGDGDDVIVLPENGFFPMLAVLDDDYNPFGPTATPIILSNITIEANGSLLQRGANTPTFRAFAVATAAFVEIGDLPIAGDGLGSLTIRNAHIRGFAMKGGNGRGGGGGGMGAGGAIFVKDGTLTVENSAFEGNFAEGGRGGIQFIPHPGGGGGGLSGNGGRSSLAVDDADIGPGGGGGGARGDGGDAGLDGGGGGGGTLVDGQPGTLFGGSGGRRCGGLGENQDDNGGRARCPGGGGGGAGEPSLFAGIPQGGDGGAGGYGGGGGGAGGAGSADVAGRDGGRGGFGGGGGGGGGGSNGTGDHGDGGSGGFGGGGGSGYDEPGGGGLFGGDGTTIYGGGGAALGGAIFAHQATITIRNCTFNGNFVVRGLSGCGTECPGTQHKGADLGAAVFALMGSVAISNSTVSGNDNTGSFGGVVYLNIKLEDPLNTPPGFFTLRNTIIAHNGVNFDAPAECAIAGANMTVAGSGNLIMRNATAADDALPCPGVTSTADPQLGTLRLNAPGNTPTMLPTLDSPAIDAADAATSLAEDQRGRTRPQRDGFDIGAVEVNPDFAISATSPLIGTPGDTLRAQVTVTSIDGFNTAVPLSVFGGGPPPGFTVTFDATTLTPVAGGTASTFASIKIGETVVPGAYTLIVQGTFGGMNRGVGVSITVATTTASMGRTIDAYRTENCIDSSGVATAFKAKLANASALHDQGRDQASNNALSALLYQIGAQSGRHVRTTCQVGGVTTDPSAVLTAGVQYLLSTEATGILNPVMGSVVKTGGSEIAGATVSIYAGKKLVASSSTDVTGFYYFADTSQLMRGVAYAAKLTSVPSGLKSTQAPTQSFTWNGRAVVLGNLVLK